MNIELALSLKNRQVVVALNGQVSHSFALENIALNKKQVEEFFENPAIFGQRLFAALFAEKSEARSVLESLPEASRLILRLGASEILLSQPWEYLYDGQAWLAARFALLRAPLNGGASPARQIQTGRPRLLFLPADPPMQGDRPAPYYLGVDNEWDALQTALEGIRPACDLLHLLPPSLDNLHAALAGSGPAGELAAQGVPFVLGMQLPVPDRSARKFTETFYRFLFAGRELPEAVRQARLALLDEPLVMGMPALYAANPATEGKILPAEGDLRVLTTRPRVELVGLPVAEHGFFGRQRELVQAGTLLTAERLRQGEAYPPLTITLRGPGGIGKTALLRRVADRFAWNFRAGVLALAMEPLPSLAFLLERLEKFFGLPEGSSLEIEARAAETLEKLNGRRALLCLDNFETVLYARNDENNDRHRQAGQVYRFLTQLPARGPVLLVSSRQNTDLPGEKIIALPGLDDLNGARLFRSRLNHRLDEASEMALARLNQQVGGHPLALRLLGPMFERESLDFETFLARLDEFLPAAAEEWGDKRRHDTLQACFAFTLEALKGRDASLREVLARLSLFHGEFLDFMALPVVYGQPQDDEQQKKQQAETARTLRLLNDYALLEVDALPVNENQALFFYHLHPALRPFAEARLTADARAAAMENYWQALDNFARTAEEQAGKDFLVAQMAYRARFDLVLAARLRDDAEGALLRFRAGKIIQTFGELDTARALWRESQQLNEQLGNLQGKSATLHAMANVYVTRGDLDGAMKLYQQALATEEGLGDLQGKSATLAMMGQVLWMFKHYQDGLQALLMALETLLQIGARPDAEKVAGILASLRKNIPANEFDVLWKQVTGSDELPDWLAGTETRPQEQGLTLEAWVDQSVQAAKTRSAEAEKWFNLAIQAARNLQYPAEIQALARVLQSMLSGNLQPDLSALPPELAALVQKALQT